MTVKQKMVLIQQSSQNNVLGKGHVMPVVKTRERKDPERYKPVSLISKVFRTFMQMLRESWLKMLGGEGKGSKLKYIH